MFWYQSSHGDNEPQCQVLMKCKVVDRGAHIMPTTSLTFIAESVLSTLEFL